MRTLLFVQGINFRSRGVLETTRMEQCPEDCQFSRVRSERKHSKTAAEVIKDRQSVRSRSTEETRA